MIARISTFRKPLLLLIGAIVAALAFPAGAMGVRTGDGGVAKKKGKPIITLTTSAAKSNKGFTLRLLAYQSAALYGGTNPPELIAFLTRKKGHATQTTEYVFSSHLKMTRTKGESSGTIKGTLPSKRGSIDMTFHATGGSSKARGRCGGIGGSKRSGTLSGSLTLHADKLGTVKLKSVGAVLSSADYGCSAPSPSTCPSKGYLLEAPHAAYLCFSKPKAKGRVREVVERVKAKPGFGAYYVYSVSNERSRDYKVGAKLASATLKGAGGIRGQAVYSGSKSSRHSTGKLTGTLYVKMAALGVVRPFAKAKRHEVSADQRHF
jgi:hypothetical protein